ncbi:MAG TPA: hypothetical protein VM674_00265 [Candidatus Acidoferrum sp.]|nr:hypothetical protein [Candidatus Acidoferrum sp.]
MGAHTDDGISERDSETDIGRYAQWGQDERATPPVERGSDGVFGTAFRHNAENVSRGTLALLYPIFLLIVLTAWLWLHKWFDVPAWVGWALIACVVMAYVIVALVGPTRITSPFLRRRKGP